MTALSNANTSGLEVVAWEARLKPDGEWFPLLEQYVAARQKDDAVEVRPSAVTAASAQARIAELEALVASIRKAQRDVIRAEIEQEGYSPISDANDRATAAEARADRLAKALEPFVRHGRACGAFGDDAGPFWIMTDSGHRDVPVDDFCAARAALQQEG